LILGKGGGLVVSVINPEFCIGLEQYPGQRVFAFTPIFHQLFNNAFANGYRPRYLLISPDNDRRNVELSSIDLEDLVATLRLSARPTVILSALTPQTISIFTPATFHRGYDVATFVSYRHGGFVLVGHILSPTARLRC
jgi:hypothetical protein